MAASENNVSLNNSLQPNLDPNSPLYIHPSENQSFSLVSQPFNGENYGDWKCSVMIALSTKNKLGFIDGRIKNQQNLIRILVLGNIVMISLSLIS